MAALTVWDFLVFGVFLMMSASVGLYHAWKAHMIAKNDRKTSRTEEYLMGGRKMPILPVALSVMSTFLSGISLLGVPAEIYQRGLLFWLYYMVGAVALILSGLFFVPIFYRFRPISIYEYFEHRFGSRALRQLAAMLFLLNTLFYMSIVIYAPAVALSAVCNVPVWPFIISVGTVCTFYTTIGGLKAVVWTDTLQAVFMYAGVVMVIIKGSMDSGGLTRVFQIVHESGRRAPLTFVDFNPLQYMSIWITLFGGTSFWLSLYGLNQMAVQRYCSLPSLKHAYIVIGITAPAYIVLGSLCCLIGVVMLAYFYDCDPLFTGEAASKDQLVIIFVTNILSGLPGLSGLFLACLFSGTLSTVSSGINSMAAVTWEDFLKRPLKGRYTDSKSSMVNKIMVCVYGIAAMALSFAAGPMGGLLKATMNMMGALAGPLIGLFCLGVFVPKANKNGAFFGAIISAFLVCWICIGNILYHPYKVYSLPLNNSNCDADNLTADNISSFYHPELHYGNMNVFAAYSMSTLLGDNSYGWKKVKRNLPRLIEYGIREGILVGRDESDHQGAVSGVVAQAEEEIQQAEAKKDRDRVQIPTNDISTIHEAIPFLPVPPALLCLLLNILLPGIGTILSGIFCFCMGQPRIQLKEGRLVATFGINLAVGLSQLMTVTFFLVGWFWSLAWGGLLLIHSLTYREALRQKRQEAVATAAIEAITKDSILHRRDVKNLVQDQNLSIIPRKSRFNIFARHDNEDAKKQENDIKDYVRTTGYGIK